MSCRAVPLWIATWSVLSLLIRYCGVSREACRTYPLNFMSEVTFLVITPLTRPASEFHFTWSPMLNTFDITPLSSLSHFRPADAGEHRQDRVSGRQRDLRILRRSEWAPRRIHA